MPDLPISGLPPAPGNVTPTRDDLLTVVNSGVTSRTKLDLVEDLLATFELKAAPQGYVVIPGDLKKILTSTSAGPQANLQFNAGSSATTVGAGWQVTIKANEFPLEINPAPGDTIEGVPAGDFFCIPARSSITLVSDGGTEFSVHTDGNFIHDQVVIEENKALDIQLLSRFNSAFISSTVGTVSAILQLVGLYENNRFTPGENALIINTGSFDIPILDNSLTPIGTVRAGKTAILTLKSSGPTAVPGVWDLVEVDDAAAGGLLAANNLDDVANQRTSVTNLLRGVTFNSFAVTGGVLLNSDLGWVTDISCSSTDFTVDMPAANLADSPPLGKPIFVYGFARTFTLRDFDGNVLTEVGTGEMVRLILTRDSTAAGTWQLSSIDTKNIHGFSIAANYLTKTTDNGKVITQPSTAASALEVSAGFTGLNFGIGTNYTLVNESSSFDMSFLPAFTDTVNGVAGIYTIPPESSAVLRVEDTSVLGISDWQAIFTTVSAKGRFLGLQSFFLVGGNKPSEILIGAGAGAYGFGTGTKQMFANFVVPANYTPGAPVELKIFWSPDDGTAGNVLFQAQNSTVTPNVGEAVGGAGVIDTVVDAAQGVTNDLQKTGVLDLTGPFVAGDLLTFKFFRDTTDVLDTYAGIAQVHGVEISYS